MTALTPAVTEAVAAVREDFAGHSIEVTADATHLTWRPDGQALVSSAADGTLRLWSLDVDEAVREIGERIYHPLARVAR